MTLVTDTGKKELHIVERSGHTRTLIPVSKSKNNGEIVFYNDSTTDKLRVDFQPAGMIMDEHGKTLSSIDVPKTGHRSVFVSHLDEGAEIKYTAKLYTAAEEDPIIIIER